MSDGVSEGAITSRFLIIQLLIKYILIHRSIFGDLDEIENARFHHSRNSAVEALFKGIFFHELHINLKPYSLNVRF